jgi:hypothetical protein
MDKYLIDPNSLKSKQNQVYCLDDYGVEGELNIKKWYDVIDEDEKFYFIKNEWYEILGYSKLRFRKQKQNFPP